MSESTNYFISQLGEPVISQRDCKINEGGTKTFWFKVFLMLIEGHICHWLCTVTQPFLVPPAHSSGGVWPQSGFSEWTGTRDSLLAVFLSSWPGTFLSHQLRMLNSRFFLAICSSSRAKEKRGIFFFSKLKNEEKKNQKDPLLPWMPTAMSTKGSSTYRKQLNVIAYFGPRLCLFCTTATRLNKALFAQR